MALSRTNLLGEVSAEGHGTGTWVTGAFTPPDNSLLVVSVRATEFAGGSSDVGTQITCSGGSLSYAKQITVDDVDYWSSGMACYTAPVSTGASMTLTFDCSTYNIHKYMAAVYAYTGYDTATPTGATASAATGVTNGAETLTLSASPASDSEVVATIGCESVNVGNSVLHGTGWTEHYDMDSAVTNFFQSQTRTGSTSTLVDWDDVSTDVGGLYQNSRFAIEILAAAAGGAQPGPNVEGRMRGFKLQQMNDAEDEGRFNELDVRNWWRNSLVPA